MRKFECVLCVHALKDKRLELSTPNSVYICSMAGPRHKLTLKSKMSKKGQGHGIMRCAAGVGMHVDMTAEVSAERQSGVLDDCGVRRWSEL